MALKNTSIKLVNPQMKTPKVFISYNHKDQEVALKIKGKLEMTGIVVVIDVEAMSTGENISEFIKKCINDSGITLSLISANSLMSAWVAMETIWSCYDETLRGRYFMPCNIDNSFFNIAFIDLALDVLDERSIKISKTLQSRLKKGHGIEDLADEHTRLNRLRVELPSIIGRLKNSLCVSLTDGHFDSGMEKVVKDILGLNPVSTKKNQVETAKIVEKPSQKTIVSLAGSEVSANPNTITIAGIEMVFVKGGEFLMGVDQSLYVREKPAHKVVLSDFYIGKYPIIQKKWEDVMGNNPSHFKNCINCPVENVSWNDVQQFIQKLNILTGKNFRLPTEAEWEFAANSGLEVADKPSLRWAGTDTESELGDYAWYKKNSDGKTHPVGTKKPNSLGIYDMSGNVSEWNNDWFDYNFYKFSPTDNPLGPSNGTHRVMRGGSWYNEADECRIAYRSGSPPDTFLDYFGFRLLLTL